MDEWTLIIVQSGSIVALTALATILVRHRFKGSTTIAEVTDKPITHVIYSQAHLDHIGSAGIFPDNATLSLNKKQQMNYKER